MQNIHRVFTVSERRPFPRGGPALSRAPPRSGVERRAECGGATLTPPGPVREPQGDTHEGGHGVKRDQEEIGKCPSRGVCLQVLPDYHSGHHTCL